MKTQINRRDFLKGVGLGVSAVAVPGYTSTEEKSVKEAPRDRPNLLWITCEDISPALGCYGDPSAITPNLDRLAAQGVLYENAFATAPVCSPARSCLITGMYATSLGTQHLRSNIRLPHYVKCFSEYLREAGYYCSNNDKQDYNFEAPTAWDDSSKMAHWRHRKPGQPFFSVFNSLTTHQSQIDGPDPRFFAKFTSNLKHEERHDPAKAILPPFYPDTPVVRKIWARYYDLITLMDREAGRILRELEEDGLVEDTIVFFFSDHGMGLPRFKRTLYDSGLCVPLIARFPKKYQHLALAKPGSKIDRLVSFVDFAPTMLSLTGLLIPDHMQGQAFLGDRAGKPREYIFGAASRVDESFELSRCVRDKRYKYVRNYMPQLPYAQPSEWPDQAEIAKELRRLVAEDKLVGPQLWFKLSGKGLEELYDTQTDPHEISNIVSRNRARLREHLPILKRMRQALRERITETVDLGFLPEAEMHIRSNGRPPYEVARQPSAYPQERILATAALVRGGTRVIPKLIESLKDPDAAVRYWAVLGLGASGREAPVLEALAVALSDPSPNVRFEAAGALCNFHRESKALPVLAKGLEEERPWVVLHAARTLQNIGEKAGPVVPAMEEALRAGKGGLYEMFIRWALEGALRNCRE
jgi:uncharacterized sulfatase